MDWLEMREWLTLEQAAEELTSVFKQHISPAGLLQFGMTGQLTISCLFVHPQSALSLPFLLQTDRNEIGEEALWELLNESNDRFRTISGLWDVDIKDLGDDSAESISAGRALLLSRHQQLIGGDTGDFGQSRCAVVASPQIGKQQRSEKRRKGGLPVAIAKRREPDETRYVLVNFRHDAARKFLDKFPGDGDPKVKLEKFLSYPGFPPELELVIRPQELTRFISEQLPEEEAPVPEKEPLTMGEHVSDQLRLLLQASNFHWMRVARDDATTHPRRGEVEKWLEDRGFSRKKSSAGASIIRPAWANKGRPPGTD